MLWTTFLLLWNCFGTLAYGCGGSFLRVAPASSAHGFLGSLSLRWRGSEWTYGTCLRHPGSLLSIFGQAWLTSGPQVKWYYRVALDGHGGRSHALPVPHQLTIYRATKDPYLVWAYVHTATGVQAARTPPLSPGRHRGSKCLNPMSAHATGSSEQSSHGGCPSGRVDHFSYSLILTVRSGVWFSSGPAGLTLDWTILNHSRLCWSYTAPTLE